MSALVQQQHLDKLCAALQKLLEAELAAGNLIAETSSGWPSPESIVVGLAQRFLARPERMPLGIAYRLINDPHWWYAEYEHLATKQMLICRF